jgi:hypothetical protein
MLGIAISALTLDMVMIEPPRPGLALFCSTIWRAAAWLVCRLHHVVSGCVQRKQRCTPTSRTRNTPFKLTRMTASKSSLRECRARRNVSEGTSAASRRNPDDSV